MSNTESSIHFWDINDQEEDIAVLLVLGAWGSPIPSDEAKRTKVRRRSPSLGLIRELHFSGEG